MRRAIVGMLVAFLLFSMLNVMFNVALVAAGPAVIRVPQEYPTIKAAIGNASAGDTIIVSEGTYTEGQINVNESITLLANGTVIVDGLQEGHVFYVTANNVNITGFTVTNSKPTGWHSGIFLEKVQYCNVSSNMVTSNMFGITLRNSSYNNVAENNITNNIYYGIILHPFILGPSSHNNLIGNIVANNTEGGILLETTRGDNTLRNNSISGSRFNFGVYGLGPIQDFINDIDTSNTVNGKPIYYLINRKGLTINSSTFPNVGYLGIVNSTNITVKDLELKNNFNGILLAYTNNSRIMGNKIMYNEWNIFSEVTNNVSIIDNSVINSPHGGIWLGYNSTGNTIYHNDFIDNMGYQAFDWGTHNIWDDGYPSGGNYWSDYPGVDEKSGPNQDQPGSDEIGDTPYNLTGSAGSQDRYPLMNPRFPFHNVAVTSVTPSKTVVGQNFSLSINVTVKNQGFYQETFDVTLYYNLNLIETQRVRLSNRTTTTLTFIWNTTGVPKGDYTMSANTSIIPDEIDTADNALTDGTVRVNMIGDVREPFGIVDIFDLVYVAGAFGARKGDPQYKPNADLNGDDIIDIFDLVLVATHFGETDPSSSTSSSSSSKSATNSPEVSVYPDEIIVYEHETFSVNVTITNVTDLYGWEFKLYWNNTVLNCTGAEIHTPDVWGEDVFAAGLGIENNFNATHGRYSKALSAQYPSPSFNGSMVVVTLTFEAKAVGSSILDLQETKLADKEAYAIPHTAVDGSVIVPLVVFAEDFEDGDVSDWTSGDTHEIVADTSRKYGGRYSGRFRRTWYGGTPRSWKAFTAPVSSGNLTVVWWAQNDYTTHSHFFSVSDGTGLKGFVLCFRYNGYIQWYSDGTYHNIQPYSADTWYKFELRIDLDRRKYSIRINDVLKVTQADANGAPSQADHFVLASADTSYYAWIDNITIYAMN